MTLRGGEVAGIKFCRYLLLEPQTDPFWFRFRQNAKHVEENQINYCIDLVATMHAINCTENFQLEKANKGLNPKI